MALRLAPKNVPMQAQSSVNNPVAGSIQAALFSDSSQARVFTAEGKVMGTTARVTTVGGTAELPQALMAMLDHFNVLWSRFLEDSDISRLNASPGEAIEVDSSTRDLIAHMIQGHHATHGAFDPTLLPALMAQGYSASLVNPENVTHLPPSSRRRGAPQEIIISGTTVTLPVGTTIDSGGAGKGYAADVLAHFAMGEGALGVLVEVGGDLRVMGISPSASAWRLAIEHPYDASRRLSVVALRDGGIATSTVAKRRFEVEGNETHHIINPHTGLSTDSDVVQATVIAPSAGVAEIATKIAFVEGSLALFRYAHTHQYQAGCYTTDGNWTTTKDWPEADA